MMNILNGFLGESEKDRLIYDGSHPVDAVNVRVSVPEDTDGVLKRGQVIDYADGAYSVHVASGEVSCIVAEETEYAAGETEVTVPVYISGTYRKSACITDVELTAADLEVFRSKGIYLK